MGVGAYAGNSNQSIAITSDRPSKLFVVAYDCSGAQALLVLSWSHSLRGRVHWPHRPVSHEHQRRWLMVAITAEGYAMCLQSCVCLYAQSSASLASNHVGVGSLAVALHVLDNVDPPFPPWRLPQAWAALILGTCHLQHTRMLQLHVLHL